MLGEFITEYIIRPSKAPTTRSTHCYITFVDLTMLERVAGRLDDVSLTFFVRNDV